MNSLIRTGPTLVLKMAIGKSERTIGYASNLSFTVTTGLKSVFVVDSPFPAEIQTAAGASQVRGQFTIYLIKGTTPESLGLVPYRLGTNEADGSIALAATKYQHIRLYDRETGELVLGCNYCKVGQYTVTASSRSVVTAILSFEGIHCITGRG